MPHYAEDDDLYSESHFLAPSRHSVSLRKSSASLRPSTLANGISSDDALTNGRHHSLAHELAVALMPEPSAGSKLLAEEFGIEFDEGAEGIDEEHRPSHISEREHGAQRLSPDSDSRPSFANELGIQETDDPVFASAEDTSTNGGDESLDGDFDPLFDSPSIPRTRQRQKTPEKDAMDALSENLEFTDKFLANLRTLDTEPGAPSSQQPKLERLASDVIRRMNESVRDRESQVRTLLECEREFRKISGDVLGQLDKLEEVDDELSEQPAASTATSAPHPHRQDSSRSLQAVIEEEPSSPAAHRRSHHFANDWELDPDRNHLGDADYDTEPSTTPIRTSFPPPPVMTGTPTPAKLVPQLTHIRSFTSSTIASLTSISEHAQVNGVATADAGRKIRSLKNKFGTWKTEWDSAERSRARIERWEAGIVDGEGSDSTATPASPVRLTGKRVDGRTLVEEQLRAFELALADANLKTQAIMAR